MICMARSFHVSFVQHTKRGIAVDSQLDKQIEMGLTKIALQKASERTISPPLGL